jgi:zinc D-Ala-D-Ala carboxypeptidase
VYPFLIEMLTDAKDDGINLLVVSAYRSFDKQKDLKSAYAVQYGTGANTFSADQGYSEHQLGTTIDFTTDAMGGALTGFEKTEAYAWLQKYAHKYGFTLSYPEANDYYIFEPWHWRFVGEDLARDLHNDGKYFYDLDQREISEYLISLFD